MFQTIGDTAGEIWTLLKENGPLSVTLVTDEIKRPKSIVYMGIGWLAREDKLIYTHTKHGVLISIKQ